VLTELKDKAATPLLAGRADAIQPRSLELLHSWGMASEVAEEGPILDHTAIFKDGDKLFYNRSSQCESRYRGIHCITQGQLEKVYIRDLSRHKALVERSTIVDEFEVKDDSSSHPVQATIKNVKTGAKGVISAKYLVGGDGAGSSIREQLKIPFDGNTTDIYWAIMDCQFKTTYPYMTTFG
jgi:phenol 2-monooxygenase